MLFAWQQAIRESDLDPTTKLVAFTVSTYMNIDGSSAHPGADRLAGDVGLTMRSVRRHLRCLERRGWLSVDERGGGRGRATVYRAAIPPTVNGDTGDTVSVGNGDTGDRETVTRVTVKGVTGVTPPAQDQPKHQQQRESGIDEVATALVEHHGLTATRPLLDAIDTKLEAGWTPATIREHPGLAAPITGARHPAGALAARVRDLGDPPADPRERQITAARAHGHNLRGVEGATDQLSETYRNDPERLAAAMEGLEALDTEEVAT